ncbi:hypothetical protein ACIQM0_18615 [Streptomyces sp. NPDC091387]|uniref:hypothetical protein n=1 Tax=Streptomyces sp. NPDC091387 TaxID=3365998 RepID=UPI0037F900B0
MPVITGARSVLRPATALAAIFLALAAVSAPGPAHAADGTGTVAEALRKSPVYVDPRAEKQLSTADADALAKKIEDADRPVFVAVLPESAEFPQATLLKDLRALTGVTGVYAVRLGDGFNAATDGQVMSRDAVANLKGAARRSSPEDAGAQLNSFVEQALLRADGSAPSSWAADGGDDSGTGLLVAGGVVVAVGAGAYALHRRSRKKKEERERTELEALRVVVDEDITAFGEELDRLGFSPSEPGATDDMRQDYTRALDAYDRAKTQMAEATRPHDVQQVTGTLEQGRFTLATLAARRGGDPLPGHRLPCFFDPRHGPSASDVRWAPEGGAPRPVPACAADAARMADGGEPQSRMVDTGHGRQPYWNAGPAYTPWAGGYFGGGGGGMLGGLLVGTMLGSVISAPSAFAATGAPAEDLPDGGDFSGAGFNPADFGSGFGGGDSGSDFGGGDW